MFFYCFELDDKSKNICTITIPFGLYHYVRLPMGIKVSTDIVQSIINKILEGTRMERFIENCGYWSNGSFNCHLMTIDKILVNLEPNSMKRNPLKCDWAYWETDFLGYWMTPTYIKRMKKKIDAILRIGQPITPT